jgi:hypothetical protein
MVPGRMCGERVDRKEPIDEFISERAREEPPIMQKAVDADVPGSLPFLSGLRVRLQLGASEKVGDLTLCDEHRLQEHEGLARRADPCSEKGVRRVDREALELRGKLAAEDGRFSEESRCLLEVDEVALAARFQAPRTRLVAAWRQDTSTNRSSTARCQAASGQPRRPRRRWTWSSQAATELGSRRARRGPPRPPFRCVRCPPRSAREHPRLA